MNYEQRIEHSKQILKSNRYLIYHTPHEYPNLQKVLEHKGIRKTILKVYQFIKSKDIFIYRRKYVFFLDNKKITEIRGGLTESVSNKYINYLCAVGLINKQYQNIGEGGEVEHTKLTDINLGFLLDTGKRRPINTFYFREYKPKELKRLDQRAKQLLDNGITPGNISCNMLMINNCKDLAKEVYYANSKESAEKKRQDYKDLLKTIDGLIKDKGYTTKLEVYWEYGKKNKPKSEVEKLFRIFKTEFNTAYEYRPQRSRDRKQFGIPTTYTGWIITKRSKDNAD